MSNTIHHPDQEAINNKKKEKNAAIASLHKQNNLEGLNEFHQRKQFNSTCQYKTIEEDRCGRTEAVTDQVNIIQTQLPLLLKRLSKIKDPRNPKKIKHKLTVLMIYGIFIFVFQVTSRREADREMTRPVFKENIKMLFPEIETIPHNDTLMRLLVRIDSHEIEQTSIEVVKKLIKNKKFARYLIDKHYPIAIDGTQKFVRDIIWSENCQERSVGKDKQKQYYVYVLEASLAFQNGMTIPVMSEFLSYTEGDTDTKKTGL